MLELCLSLENDEEWLQALFPPTGEPGHFTLYDQVLQGCHVAGIIGQAQHQSIAFFCLAARAFQTQSEQVSAVDADLDCEVQQARPIQSCRV